MFPRLFILFFFFSPRTLLYARVYPPVQQEENLNLRLRLNVGDEAEDEENSEISEIKSRLDDMVASGVAEGEILQTMDMLKDRFADYGRCVDKCLVVLGAYHSGRKYKNRWNMRIVGI